MRDDRVGLKSHTPNKVARKVWAVMDLDTRGVTYALFIDKEKADRYISEHADGDMMYSDEMEVWG